ncbi:hypothetical protein TNCV_4259911 [Trichonephila clavipes]|nr:hypothetical protein TNCV_4259911 [Trichonephila clavipes]
MFRDVSEQNRISTLRYQNLSTNETKLYGRRELCTCVEEAHFAYTLGKGAVEVQKGVLHYRPEPIDSIFCKQSLDLDPYEKKYCDAIKRNSGTLQFDLYQSQKRAGMHIPASYIMHQNNLSQGNNVEIQSVYENPTEQISHSKTL